MKMKLEDLLNTIIDGNYPEGFLIDKGICHNVGKFCSLRDLITFLDTIEALYLDTNYPVGGKLEYRNSRWSGDMYASGWRAEFCRVILKELNRPKWQFWSKPRKRRHYLELSKMWQPYS